MPKAKACLERLNLGSKAWKKYPSTEPLVGPYSMINYKQGIAIIYLPYFPGILIS